MTPKTPQEVLSQARKEFDDMFLIEPNPGQKKHCDLCGHDHTERGDNKGYGKGIKDWHTSTLQAFIGAEIARLEGMKKDFDEDTDACTDSKKEGFNQALQDQIFHLTQVLTKR